MSKEKSDLRLTPFTEGDIMIMAMALVELHQDRPDLKVELFGVEFPDAKVREKKLVPYQARLIATFA